MDAGKPTRRIYGTETEFGLYWKIEPKSIPSLYCLEALKRFAGNPFEPRWLYNGGRFHLDNAEDMISEDNSREIKYSLATPEWATPETLSVYDAVCWEKAGELIVREIFDLDGKTGKLVFLAKHGRGRDYAKRHHWITSGHHENYSLDLGGGRFREFFCEPGSAGGDKLVTFLVSRLIFHGAGWFPPSLNPPYIISQRADFMENSYGSSTTGHRAINCTGRDGQSHAGPHIQRLHLIVGDHPMAEPSLYLTLGTTGLVLRMLLESDLLNDTWLLTNPPLALRLFSNDPWLKVAAPVKSPFGLTKTATALEIQSYFCGKAEEFCALFPISEEEQRLIFYWRDVLERLKEDIFSLNQELDWVIKWSLAESYLQKHKLSWQDVIDKKSSIFWRKRGGRKVSLVSRLEGLDLAYHDLSSKGLYYRLLESDKIKRIVKAEDVQWAMDNPPQNTRAKVRGEFLRWLQQERRSPEFTEWETLALGLRPGEQGHKIPILNPFENFSQEWDNFRRNFKD